LFVVFVPSTTFVGLRVPLAFVCSEVVSGVPVVFKCGELRVVVRASCCFPGVFPPIEVASRRLYDGGVSEVVPVRRAREMAGETGVVVAIDCNSGTRWPAADSFVALALRAGVTLLRGRSRGELAGADLVIAPQMGASSWMQPRKIPQFCQAGERAVEEGLPELRALVESDPAPSSLDQRAAGRQTAELIPMRRRHD
jgi:NTE family protein